MSTINEQAAPAVKYALCVQQQDAFAQHPMVWNPYLVDRAIADNQETIDSENLQLLPYVTLCRGGNPANGELATDTYLLAYDRGSKGAESRLHAWSSIGFGGHIDEVITTNIINLVAEEALRELQEEIGYKPETKMFYQAVAGAVMERRFIYLPDTDTGKVHLGLFISIPFEAPADLSTLTLEEGQIANVRWINGTKISAEDIALFEPWSAYVLSQNQTQTAPPDAPMSADEAQAALAALEKSTDAANENGTEPEEVIYPAPVLDEIIPTGT